jgi:hypothetical protein
MAAERFTIKKFTNPSGEQVWRVEGRVEDVLRHTALSNHHAICKDEKLTADWAGNSVATLRKHYRKNVPRHQAEAFWAITPASLDAEFGSGSRESRQEENPAPDDAGLIPVERSPVLQT